LKQQLEDKNKINKNDKSDYDEKLNQLQKDINKAENATLQANNSKIVLDNQLLIAQDRVSKLTLENETLKKKLNKSLHANDSKEEIVNIKNK
jgi:hypothetical protein